LVRRSGYKNLSAIRFAAQQMPGERIHESDA
jgi:hypothetical protein